jgi:hypothetical protein
VGARACLRAEDLLMVDSMAAAHVSRAAVRRCRLEAQAWAALVTGVRDYLGKNGFPGAIIGLSGGIDSALVLAVAVDALGADKVRTVMMPSPYTADISWIDARDMADAWACATTRSPSRRCSTPSRQPGAAVRRPGRRHDRREPAGPHPRHAADGAVQQDRLPSC